MTPVEQLTQLFGSKAALARAAGTDPAMVTRWEKPIDWKGAGHVGNGGRVPPRHNRAILAAAAALVKDKPQGFRDSFMIAVAQELDPSTCPTCGQPIDDGRVL